jgi:hypothetical protein
MMMKNKFLKEYIICYLFQEIESVTNQYIKLLNKYEVCAIDDINSNHQNSFRKYEDRILSFFNNILEDEPLKDIEKIIEEWQKNKHNPFCNHHIGYEELIASYTILKETLTLMIQEYSSDFNKTNLIINDLELLDHKIQEFITEGYRSMQMHFNKKDS